MATFVQLTGQMLHRADIVGASTLRLLTEIRRSFGLVTHILSAGLTSGWHRNPAIRNVIIRQIYFTGVQSLPWVFLIALGIGVLAVYNIVDFARSIQDMSLIGQLISDLLVLEVAPLVVTILMLCRSGVAVVTELGTMHTRGEDLALKSMGINVQAYLLWPRLLAFTLCGLILIFAFVFVSIWLGGLMVALSSDIQFVDFLMEVRRGTSMEEMALLIFKGLLYPVLIAVILLNQGCKVGREPNLIPVHATRGVLGSLIAVLMADALIALLGELL
ncbi:MAG: MlaE family ABC transporter permease [Mariprofundus sp.]